MAVSNDAVDICLARRHYNGAFPTTVAAHGVRIRPDSSGADGNGNGNGNDKDKDNNIDYDKDNSYIIINSVR